MSFIEPAEEFRIFCLQLLDQITLGETQRPCQRIVWWNRYRFIESPKTVEEHYPLVPRKRVFIGGFDVLQIGLHEALFHRLRNAYLSTTSSRIFDIHYSGEAPVVAHLYHSWTVYNARNLELIGCLTSHPGVKVTHHQIRHNFFQFLFHQLSPLVEKPQLMVVIFNVLGFFEEFFSHESVIGEDLIFAVD